MRTNILRKYIDIINESSRAVDPDLLATALTKLAKNQLDQARQAQVDGDKEAAQFRQEHGKKILSLIPAFQRGWAQGFTKLRKIDKEESMSGQDSDFAGDVLEGLESMLNADWIYKEYYHGDWKNQSTTTSTSGDLITKIRARLAELHDTDMEPEEVYDQVADEFNMTGRQLEKLLQSTSQGSGYQN